jgi:hypothetical protein
MVTPIGGQGRRCSNCGTLIQDTADCTGCSGADRQAEPGAVRAPHAQPVVETLECFLLSEEEAEVMKGRIVSGIERGLASFLKKATLNELLPLIVERGLAYFVGKGVPYCDAEELAATLGLKVVAGVSEEFPHGNVGSWIATIRFHMINDYWRKKYVEERCLGSRKCASALDEVDDGFSDDTDLRLFIAGLPEPQREIVERLLGGDKWKDIVKEYEARIVNEVRKTVQSMDWDGQSVPLRKTRRR